MKRLGVAAALVDGRLLPGDVGVDGDVVAAVGLPGGGRGIAVAGFVDVQVNGFAGVDFTHADLDGYRSASAAMARTGVTSFLPTIPTAAPEQYRPALAAAAAAMAEPLPGARAKGVHLEGPFLSPARAGAHRPAWLRDPDSTALAEWLELATVAVVTLAPELPGALDVVRMLVARGVVVSIGHSDASPAEVHAAFDAGASAVTHLWNAQRAPTARDPGLTVTALARDDVWIGLIADLVHVARETVLVSARAAGDRLVVVTDAVAAAGLPTTTADGVVRLADGTIAGSACSLDAGVRNLVGIGLSVEAAVAAATTAPAAMLRRPDLGRLAAGARADVTVLDDHLAVGTVLIGGVEA